MPATFASCAPESDAQAEPLSCFAEFWRAYRACRNGKQRSASAQRYALNLFDLLLATVAALNARQWKPSAATAFVVNRPKAREVLAAAFADRVVHHWLVPLLERQFEPVFIFDVICRPRVVGHCHEALTAWRRRWVRSGPASTVIDLPDAAREALAASVASYAAHFKHAAHARLWRRLRARHGVLCTLFQSPVAGHCRPLWQPPRHLYRLPDQWRWFHRQCPQWFGWPPGAQADAFRPWILWLQVGRMVETYGDHARRIATHWPGHGGQPVWRQGLGAGLAWPGPAKSGPP